MTEHGALLLGVWRNDGVNDGVGSVSGGTERGHEHRIVSVNNAKLQFYD